MWLCCPRVHQVQSAADLRLAWFRRRDVVGITAGTSTPDDVIDRVERRIRELAAVIDEEQTTCDTGEGHDDAACSIETMLARRRPVRRRDGVGRGRERTTSASSSIESSRISRIHCLSVVRWARSSS